MLVHSILGTILVGYLLTSFITIVYIIFQLVDYFIFHHYVQQLVLFSPQQILFALYIFVVE
jgi:hypothetical protein